MKAGRLSSAEFVRRNGWGVGTVLRGEPIFTRTGREIERARLVRITAVGEKSVLGRTQIIGEPKWWTESLYDFNSREWSLEAHPEQTGDNR